MRLHCSAFAWDCRKVFVAGTQGCAGATTVLGASKLLRHISMNSSHVHLRNDRLTHLPRFLLASLKITVRK